MTICFFGVCVCVCVCLCVTCTEGWWGFWQYRGEGVRAFPNLPEEPKSWTFQGSLSTWTRACPFLFLNTFSMRNVVWVVFCTFALGKSCQRWARQLNLESWGHRLSRQNLIDNKHFFCPIWGAWRLNSRFLTWSLILNTYIGWAGWLAWLASFRYPW